MSATTAVTEPQGHDRQGMARRSRRGARKALPATTAATSGE